MNKNPFASQLEEAFGPDHAISIERQGLQYLVAVGDGPVHLVSSSNVAEALNEAAEGVGRAEFLRLLGVPEAATDGAPAEPPPEERDDVEEDDPPPADDLDHDGDGPADTGEATAEPETDETDPDRCLVCGSAGGEECRPGCDCEWCRGMAERDAETQQATGLEPGGQIPSPGGLNAAIEAAGDGGAVLIPAGAPLVETGTADNDCDDAPAPAPTDAATPPTAERTTTATEHTASTEPVSAAFLAAWERYEAQPFNDLRRVFTAKTGRATPRGTSRTDLARELARLDEELAAPSATAAETPEPPADDCDGAELGDTFLHTHAEPAAEPPPAAPAPETIPAAQATTGRLYRHADGTLLRILSDPDVRGFRMAAYFQHGGQIAGRMLARDELLLDVPQDTPFETPNAHRDPRIPPTGTVLSREHDGKTWTLRVDHSGFTLFWPCADGSTRPVACRSLSAAAREVLDGTRVNGPHFWGLDRTADALAKREAEKVARRREREGVRLAKKFGEWLRAGEVSERVLDELAAYIAEAPRFKTRLVAAIGAVEG